MSHSGVFNYQAKQLAENGFYTISDTEAHTGDWFAFQVITEAVIASITDSDSGAGDITSQTLSQGMVIYGNISGITLTSGIVRMFKN